MNVSTTSTITVEQNPFGDMFNDPFFRHFFGDHVHAGIPSGLALTVFPNPMGGEATIRYTVMGGGDVSIAIYDILGSEVKALAATPHRAGTYDVPLETKDLRSGLYFCRLSQGGATETLTLRVVK